MEEALKQLENEIKEIEDIILAESKVKCHHIMCENCLRDMEDEKAMKLALEIKVTEKRELLAKFNQFK